MGKCYSRNNDDLIVGDAKLATIAYCYYKDRFYFCNMRFNGLANFAGLKSALFQKFGQGAQLNQFMQDYTWLSAEDYIDLKYNEIGDKGEITYMYRPISTEQTQDSDQKAKQAADKL